MPLKLEDLIKISTIVGEEYPESEFTVIMKVPNKATLDRINEDYYYRQNKEGEPESVDRVDIELGKLHFIYAIEGEKLEIE